MSIIVQKYGGSSLADIEKIKNIAKKISDVKNTGQDIVVVVSAMGKTTNNLIEMANQLSSNPIKREMDMLLSAGERITMSLLCIALQDIGVKAVSLTGSQAGIITNDCHNDARVIEVRPFRVQDELRKGKVVVVGGFQGVSYKRDVTTLGRGGSDTSAVAIAAALDAEACEIYSDVDGVYSSDPNVISNTIHLPEISYQHMQEMSNAGAKVLNAQAVEFAKKAGIAIYARSTFSSDKETIIRLMAPGESTGVKSVVYENDIVRIIINSKDNFNDFNWIINFLENEAISIKELNYIDSNEDNEYKISFVLSIKNVYKWNELEKEIKEKLKEKIKIDYNLSAVSLIGDGINKDNQVLIKTVQNLKNNDVTIYGISTTSFRLSLLVQKPDMEKVVKLLHHQWIEEMIER